MALFYCDMAKLHFFLGLLLLAFSLLDLSNATAPRKSVGIYELKKGNFSLKLTNWGATVMSVILPDAKGNLADVALGFDTVAQYFVSLFGSLEGNFKTSFKAIFKSKEVDGSIPGQVTRTIRTPTNTEMEFIWNHDLSSSHNFVEWTFDNSPDFLLGVFVRNDSSYLGPIVGRVANRIGGAQFTLNGRRYRLVANEGNNTLHGGRIGFSKVIWMVKHQKRGKFPSITFAYHSFDGEQGFPGDLDVSATYKIVGDYDLRLTMKAKALNKPTPVSLAHHIYWNLGGHNSGDILSNTLQIFASNYTPVDKFLIPTGQIVPVKGTPYDFLQPDTIGRRIGQIPPGYDINYAIDPLGQGDKMKKVAYLKDNNSGRALMLWASAPGMQLYTSNWLEGVVGKGGYEYKPHAAVCLETLGFPDSVNHPNFPSQIVNPGEVYQHKMLFKFSFH